MLARKIEANLNHAEIADPRGIITTYIYVLVKMELANIAELQIILFEFVDN